MDSQLKKGLLEFCVLASLEQEDSYGYQIIKKLSAYISLSESTLYSILRRMEDAGNVTMYTEEHNGRLRKYFHLSERGENYLSTFRDEITQIIAILEFINKTGGDV